MEYEAITAYCQAVEKNLNLPKKQKKQLLHGLYRELEERAGNISDLPSPEEMTAELMESVSPETVERYYGKKKRALQATVAVLAVLLVLLTCRWIQMRESQVVRAEEKITVNEVKER